MSDEFLARLWQEFSGRLGGFFRKQVRDDQLADDLVQETFLRIRKGLGSLRAEDRVGPWLFRTARNTLVDHYRRERRALELRAGTPGRSEPPGTLNRMVGRWLLEFVDGLPETYREAVKLAEVDGLPREEIAARLGISVANAKARVQRGRKLLQKKVLDCCALEFDRRGNVLGYRKRACDGCSS
jgi:RNA polymerase sigma-70 factor, ECF subfamily